MCHGHPGRARARAECRGTNRRCGRPLASKMSHDAIWQSIEPPTEIM